VGAVAQAATKSDNLQVLARSVERSAKVNLKVLSEVCIVSESEHVGVAG
jgi:hypothetical protein